MGIKNFLFSMVVKRAFKALDNFLKEAGMTGWKTKLAGIGMIVTGLGIVISGLVGDSFDFAKVKEGAQLILAGLAVLGLGHKIDKAGAAK